jgi:hypothetical protein
MANIPKRLYVLQTLSNVLQASYGYDKDGNPYDLTNRVFRGRSVFGADEVVPMLSILESSTPDVPVYAGEAEAVYEPQWRIFLQGWAEDDKENPTDPAHWLMAAVESRLGLVTAKRDDGSNRPKDPAIYMLGKTVAGFSFGPGVVRPADDKISSRAFFYLPVRIALAGSVDDPYLSI